MAPDTLPGHEVRIGQLEHRADAAETSRRNLWQTQGELATRQAVTAEQISDIRGDVSEIKTSCLALAREGATRADVRRLEERVGRLDVQGAVTARSMVIYGAIGGTLGSAVVAAIAALALKAIGG